jgi:acetyl esterase/lipase
MVGSVLVLPGGGYRMHAPHETEPIADWLEALGWRSRVVRYPLLTAHPAPLAAVRREIAAEREAGATTVGVIGFSAGGHLAGLVALAPGAPPGERPDFAVLGYPVVSLVEEPHVRSRAIVLGTDDGTTSTTGTTGAADAADDRAAELSLERLVRVDSPPMFVWHTSDDPTVPAAHTYLLGRALAEVGVPHETHVFPGDVHGIGLASGTEAAAWPALCADWLGRRAAPTG